MFFRVNQPWAIQWISNGNQSQRFVRFTNIVFCFTLNPWRYVAITEVTIEQQFCRARHTRTSTIDATVIHLTIVRIGNVLDSWKNFEHLDESSRWYGVLKVINTIRWTRATIDFDICFTHLIYWIEGITFWAYTVLGLRAKYWKNPKVLASLSFAFHSPDHSNNDCMNCMTENCEHSFHQEPWRILMLSNRDFYLTSSVSKRKWLKMKKTRICEWKFSNLFFRVRVYLVGSCFKRAVISPVDFVLFQFWRKLCHKYTKRLTKLHGLTNWNWRGTWAE